MSTSSSAIGAAALSGLSRPHHQKVVNAYAALYDNKLAGETVPAIPDHTPSTAAFQPDQVETVWSETCMFRDPLMKVNNLDDYKLQFAGLHSICKNISLEILSVTVGTGIQDVSEKTKSGSEISEVIIIDANCKYEVNSWISATVRQITRLGLNKEGRIQAHEDMWSYADLIESIPLLGKLYRAVQPIAGTIVARLLNRNYARKAGVPSGSRLTTNMVHATYHPIESIRLGAAENAAKEAVQEAEDEASGKSSKRSGKQQEGKRQAFQESKKQDKDL